MTEPIDELLEWLHTFDELQFSCNHRNVIEKIWQIKSKEQLTIHSFGNHVFCPHCGDKRQLKVETDLNSGIVCKSALCKNQT